MAEILFTKEDLRDYFDDSVSDEKLEGLWGFWEKRDASVLDTLRTIKGFRNKRGELYGKIFACVCPETGVEFYSFSIGSKASELFIAYNRATCNSSIFFCSYDELKKSSELYAI